MSSAQHAHSSLRHRSYIAKVIKRNDFEIPSYYFTWANAFAVVTNEFVQDVGKIKRIPRASKRQLLTRGWKRYHGCNGFGGPTYYKDLNNRIDRIHVTRSPHGWMIRMSHRGPNGHGAAKILINLLGDLPILCTTFPQAAQLGESSDPELGDEYPIGWHAP
jgi:hypothetical protein